VAKKLQVVSAVNVPYPISWADEERDLTAWLGNELQQEAFNKLYSLSEKVYASNDDAIKLDFNYLQVSDHFYYMSTKFFSDGDVHSYFNPYDTPYDAFINYMNVLSDFEIRVNAAVQSAVDDDVARLSKIIKEKDEQLERLERRLASQFKKAARPAVLKEEAVAGPVAKKQTAAAKPDAKKVTAAAKPDAKKVTAATKTAPKKQTATVKKTAPVKAPSGSSTSKSTNAAKKRPSGKKS